MTHRPSSRDVLVVTPSAVRTTANRCTLALLGWCRTEIDQPPRVIALAGGELKQEMRDSGVKVIEVPRSVLRSIERLLLKAGQPRAARGVRKILHRYLFSRPPRPDVILAISVQGAGPVLRHVHPDTRLVTYCYESGALLDQIIDAEMMARLVKGTSTWIAASDDIARDLADRGVSPGDITTIRPFIDGPTPDRAAAAARRATLGLRPDEVVVGGVGRSDWRDGPDLFLRAASIINRRHPDLPVRFVWVGAPAEGPSRWILDHDVRCAGLTDKFTFTGSPDEGDAWVEVFDVLCLTSRIDPPPPTALVAGALAVPLVGFAQAGVLQMADEAGGAPAVHAVGYLDVEAMAEAVATLVADPTMRRTGGEAFQDSVMGGRLTADGAPEVWDVVRTALAQGGRP